VRNIFVPELVGFPKQQPSKDGKEQQQGERSEDLPDGTVVNIRLSELTPGMRLARPLATLDGKVILQADTLLDQETLFNLWQLCAVRALDARVSVQVKV